MAVRQSPTTDRPRQVDTDVAEIDELFLDYARTRDRRLRDELVLRHEWVARTCARRFSDRGEPLADLLQVAQIGVVKAVERFDPTLGNRFASFAMPTVLGELRRHFRDTTWHLSVPRRAKELSTRMNATGDLLSQRLGRAPRIDELAEELGVDPDLVAETIAANRCYRPSSIDGVATDGDDQSGRPTLPGADDPEYAQSELRVVTLRALRRLDERSRNIVVWRFYEGCTQSEIGDRLGIGQVQVSRLLRGALERLREMQDVLDLDVERHARAV
jgi:RNA polymerase sigma-B factor